ncbi:MAG TPA: hypothetical protein VMT53_14570 [Terriglobales bacterium]|nr:hypothetical protein [Terriglobales bacterium]
MALNTKRIWIGGLAGGLVWIVWGFLMSFLVIGFGRYAAAQQQGLFLHTSRYPAFNTQWMVLMLILGIGIAHLYAWSRSTLQPGPGAAIKLGAVVGFIAGFPLNFAQAAWSPIDRIFPLGWMLEMWIGAILATLVAGVLYKD